ncbi:MAG: type III pantothenate kinase [Oscillospiraceae bacterium]|jgi:type III pantothenate kinase|nr:type III pantothenate kinase [Oscillospiraceae bacterium]
MLMVIDVGNTNLVFGLYDGDALRAKFRLSTDAARTADEIGLHIAAFFRHFELPLSSVDDAVIGSVVPQVMYPLTHALQKYLDLRPRVVGEDIDLGLVNLCQEPLGADRALTGLGAMARFGAPLIVVDFGTATKVDAFNAERAYLGGVICPGIKISMEALFARAAKLPRVEIRKPRSVIGVNTVEQMQAGAVYGFVGGVTHIVEHTRRAMGDPNVPVVATGGLASLIAEYADCIDHTERNLTLEGLKLAAQR